MGACKSIISADPYETYSVYSDDEIDQAMTQESLKIDVKCALNELKDREREVLELYYGFKGKPKTLNEIANKYGLSRERTRQIHVRGIRRLRLKSTLQKSPVRHLQYYIAGSLNRPLSKYLIKKELYPPNSVSTTIAINDTHHSNNLYDPPLAKENFKENFKESSTLKPIPKEIKKASPFYEEPKKPIVRCLNCPNPRVSKDDLCSGCQDMKDKGYKLVYYERYLKRNRLPKDYEIYVKRRRRKGEKNKVKREFKLSLISDRAIELLSEDG